MRKIFTFLFAALMSVSMFGAIVTEDISMDAANWTWGSGSAVVADGDMLKCILTSEWGAMATGWNTTDLSGWDKIVIVVENMNGCDGEEFKLKAYLRDYVNKDSEQGQMEGYLGLDAEDRQQNYLEINLKQEGKNVNLTACGVLGIQCQPNGAEFKISRVYLEKEVEEQLFDLRYEDKWLRVTPKELGVHYFVFIEDKEYYDNRYQQYDQPTMQGYMDYVVGVVVPMGATSSFVWNGDLNLNPDPIFHTWYDNDHMIVNHDYVAFVFKFENDARVGNVEYLAFTYAGEPQGIENIVLTEKAQKVIVDGVLYIVRDGKLYDITGTQVK